jgi:prephenate dehydratase
VAQRSSARRHPGSCDEHGARRSDGLARSQRGGDCSGSGGQHLRAADRGLNIEDIAGNKTRFFVVGSPDKAPQPSGRDKTSLTFFAPHKPGALVQVLEVFRRHGINISMIQSRPSRQAAWTYAFFADVQGHQNDESMQAALEELRQHTVSVKIMGSYPEAST